jgi:hypothetical protein
VRQLLFMTIVFIGDRGPILPFKRVTIRVDSGVSDGRLHT